MDTNKEIKNLPKVYIVVLNWNDYENTKECIASLDILSYPNYKILILDNNSQDKSGELLKKNFPQYEVILNSSNLGYTGGNNVGIKIALERDADYIFILNNDTIVKDKEFLNDMVAFMEKHKTIGILGPKIVSYSSKEVLTDYFSSIWWGNIEKQYLKNKKEYGENSRISTRLLGAAILVRGDLFKKIGLLKEDYFMYSEEDDFSLRAIINNFDVVYFPNQTVYRKVDNDGRAYNERKTYYCTRNKIHMLRENLNGGFGVYMNIFNVLGEAKTILKHFLKGEFSISFCILKGLLHGFSKKYGINKVYHK